MKSLLPIWLLAGSLLALPGPRSAVVHGNATLGYYYIRAQVGTPPQEKLLILDTGSQLTVFPCQGCLNCGVHSTPLFDQGVSTTFEFLSHQNSTFGWTCPVHNPTRCTFQQRYLEGSEYMGYFATDAFAMGKEDRKFGDFHVLGCALSETNGFFNQRADGIFGLGITRPNSHTPPTLPDALNISGAISNPNFAVLLGENKGRLTLGGWNSALHDPGAKATFIDCSKLSWGAQYQLDLVSMQVGHKQLSYDFRRMREQNGLPSLDTGSTYIHLARPLYNLFTNAFSDFCAQNSKHCGQKQDFQECFYYMKEKHGSLEDFFATFPKIHFGFNGHAEIDLEPRDYMVLNSEVETFYCPGFQPLDRTVFGTAFMRNRDVYFDKEKKTIGFVRATLDAATLQTDERPDLSDDWPELQKEMSELGWEDDPQPKSHGWLASIVQWVESPFVWGFLGMVAKTVGLVVAGLALYIVCFVVG